MKNKSPLLIILTVIIAVLFAVSLGLSLSTCKKQQASALSYISLTTPVLVIGDKPWEIELPSYFDDPSMFVSPTIYPVGESAVYASQMPLGLSNTESSGVNLSGSGRAYYTWQNVYTAFTFSNGRFVSMPGQITLYWVDIGSSLVGALPWNGSYPQGISASTRVVYWRFWFTENKSADYFNLTVFKPSSSLTSDAVRSFPLVSRPGDFNEGFSAGYSQGLIDGGSVSSNELQIQYDLGYNAGYNVGASTSLDQISPYYLLGGFMNQFLNINIFPGVSIGWLFTVQFGFILLGLILKIFLGG